MKSFGDGRLQRGNGGEIRYQVCMPGDTKDPQNKYENQTPWVNVTASTVTDGEAKERTSVGFHNVQMNVRDGLLPYWCCVRPDG